MTRIAIDLARRLGTVDRRIFGQFIEHLGRCIYGGVYDEGSPLADARGFRRDVLDRIELREDRFGFEPEVTARIARARCRIYEVPISYWGRTYEEGKKITWKDGVRGLWCVVRYNVFG